MSLQPQPLNAFFMSMPLELRRNERERFANLHGITVKSSHHFIKNHPNRRSSLQITEQFTGYKVTRFDLFPDIYNREELCELMEKATNAK